jgi:hypothetical protein
MSGEAEREGVSRAVVGFHQDEEGQWVAELACGHGQHIRHDPPWQNRPWVMGVEGRASFIGTTVYCVRCVNPSPTNSRS